MKKFTLVTLALLVQLSCDSLAAAPAAPRPQDDLFRAANGHWLATTAIAADKDAAFGADLPAISDAHVRAIVDELAAGRHAPGSIEQKVGAFYASYLDTAAIDRAGLAPVAPALAEIAAIGTRAELARWQGRMQGRIESPIYLRLFPDFKDPKTYRALTWQGGLGMPDRRYYLDPADARMAAARSAYETYLGTLAALSGEKNAADVVARVMRIESAIAKAHWDQADTRDPAKSYNPMNAAALQARAPGFDWAAFLQASGLAPTEAVTVAQPSAATAIARLFAGVALDDWKLYFKMRTLDAATSVLPAPFRAARQAFRGAALQGTLAAPARWESGIDALNRAMGEAVGQVYVARHFPAPHKRRMRAIVDSLLAAARELVAASATMTPATKQQALRKLETMTAKIGAPDAPRDYSALAISAGDAFGNVHRARRFEWERQAAKAGKRVDRNDWLMTPQTVNAFYDPFMNEIVFPAAHLQAPYFDMAADDAANYGAVGVLIGHEISHGFDEQGSQFDADGVMRNWWADADRAAFAKLGAKLVAQFGAIEALPGKRVDGKLTLNENIADLAGLQIAYRAYQRSLGGKAAPVVDGATGVQRFFMSYARSQRAKWRDETMLKLLASDPHAPSESRVNAAVVNLDAFHEAYGTGAGDAMFKPAGERIRIW
ncbi:M13 family metallopeptidase [Massilia glaciei]|nr:M13 family metallopeptidase [Massilia glaciei]